jgi:putative aminopeptidase FrvX
MMRTLKNPDLLKDLCATPGISGCEQQVAARIRSELDRMGLTHETDRIGNLTAHLPGKGQRVVLFTHMDEVGLIVRRVHSQGFLYVERVGGTSVSALPGQRVQVWGDRGPVAGVIGVLSQHLDPNPRPVDLYGVFIDIGASTSAEVAKMGIEVGQQVTYAVSFDELDGRIASKSLDDRMGCYLLLQAAAQALKTELPLDIYLLFVVQEEAILSGGLPSVQALQPDWAVGLDATLAFDTPDIAVPQTDVCLGGGTVTKVMDHLRGQGMGLIAHRGLREHIETVARENGIPFQREVVTGLSTAGSPMPFIRGGLPVAAISFPLRYAHSPVEVVDLSDIQHTLDLVEKLIRQPWRIEET